ncbi:peroxiredoxin family protein [bacterium]|nr:MAG: peroxiredoxin family protein [bacterium]
MALFLTTLILATSPEPTKPPAVGDKAPAFDVRTLDRKQVRLAPLLKQGPVVLVMLRGFPGYQCPICTRQVGELFAQSEEFAKRKATVVLVYPGPSAELEKRAGEFVSGKEIPASFRFTIDPDFEFAKSYGLRWDANGETAYPSTFVVGLDGRVTYAKISQSHGDRAPIKAVLAALEKTAPRR